MDKDVFTLILLSLVFALGSDKLPKWMKITKFNFLLFSFFFSAMALWVFFLK